MMQKFTHKGYTLKQTDYNYHYMIFDSDGDMVMHVPYDKPLTEEKAKEFIDGYIFLAGKLDEVGDKLFEEEEETDIWPNHANYSNSYQERK